MKTAKSIVLLVATFALAFVGVVLLIGEPVENGIFDSVLGLIGMKALSLVFMLLSACSWYGINERDRNAIISWIKLHF